jgi:uracil-DNA glycosylase
MTVSVRISAAVRCAPPDNRPTPAERTICAGWLDREVALLPRLRVLVALGGFAWTAALATATAAGWSVPRPRPRFGHGTQVRLDRDGAAVTLIGCYHPSQQNTFTGRLTEPMLDEVLARAAALAG